MEPPTGVDHFKADKIAIYKVLREAKRKTRLNPVEQVKLFQGNSVRTLHCTKTNAETELKELEAHFDLFVQSYDKIDDVKEEYAEVSLAVSELIFDLRDLIEACNTRILELEEGNEDGSSVKSCSSKRSKAASVQKSRSSRNSNATSDQIQLKAKAAAKVSRARALLQIEEETAKAELELQMRQKELEIKKKQAMRRAELLAAEAEVKVIEEAMSDGVPETPMRFTTDAQSSPVQEPTSATIKENTRQTLNPETHPFIPSVRNQEDIGQNVNM